MPTLVYRLALGVLSLLLLSAPAAAWERAAFTEELEAGERTEESAQYINFFGLGEMVYLTQGPVSIGCAADEPMALAMMIEPSGPLPDTPVGTASFLTGDFESGPYPLMVNGVSGVATVFLSANPTRARWLLEDMMNGAHDRVQITLADGTGAPLALKTSVPLSGFAAAARDALLPVCGVWFQAMP